MVSLKKTIAVLVAFALFCCANHCLVESAFAHELPTANGCNEEHPVDECGLPCISSLSLQSKQFSQILDNPETLPTGVMPLLDPAAFLTWNTYFAPQHSSLTFQPSSFLQSRLIRPLKNAPNAPPA